MPRKDNVKPHAKATILIAAEYVSPTSNSTGEYFFHNITKFLEGSVNIVLVAPCSLENKIICEDLVKKWPSSFSVRFSRNYNFECFSSLKSVFWLLSAFSIWYNVARNIKNVDILVFGTNPIFLTFLNGFSFHFWKHKSVLICYDIFPDNLIAITDKSYIKFIAKFFRPFFYSSLKKVNKVLTIGECMSAYLVNNGISKDSIITISNWADGSEIYPLQHFNSNKCIRFQFFGNLGSLQCIEKIIDAFHFIKVRNASFIFAGKGKNRRSVENFIHNNHTLVHVEFKGSVDRSERNHMLNDCDIAIVSLDKRVTGMGVPSKAYYSLAAGKPLLVIADASCETSRLVDKYNLGWVVSSDSSEDLARVIDEICQCPLLIPSSEYIRKIFQENFDRNLCTNRIFKIIVNEVRV